MIIPARTPHTRDVGNRSNPQPAVAGPRAADCTEEDERRSAFRNIFEAHAPYVWRSLLGLGVPQADVPDASQLVFMVLYKKLHQLEPGCSIRTFVYGMCLRVASDFRRRGHRRHERLYADPPVVGRGANQEDRTSQRQTLLRMDAALARLSPEQREVFVLYEIEELPMIEVARAIGRPLQTAYSRLHAARKAVIAAMAPHLQEE